MARIKLTRLIAENLWRLRLAQVEFIPEKGLVRVTGKNGSGKTSFLRLIKAGMGGAGEIIGDPVNHDAEDGKGGCRLQLSNGFTVERRFTAGAKRSYLTIVGPKRGKHGQALMNEWLGPLSFDPLHFFALKPKEQRKLLLSLGTDPELASKLDKLREERDRVYAVRTPQISKQQQLRKVEEPTGERPDPVDTSAELRRLEKLQEQQKDRAELARLKDERAAEERGQVKHLREDDKAIADAEAELRKMHARRETRRGHIEALREEVHNMGRDLERIEDPGEQIAAVQRRIAEADSVREALKPWERWEEAQQELKAVTAKADALTNQLATIDAREREMIASAGIPIEGLTFSDEGEPRLNGNALEVASGRERVTMAVDVAIAANPEIGICLIDEEANGLDLEALEELDARGKKHDFQIIAVRIGLEGPGEIIVEDGEARDYKQLAQVAS